MLNYKLYARISDEILDERLRQERLFKEGKHSKTVQMCSNEERSVILGEEVGEVCKVLCEAIGAPLDKPHLREELIQVAAVCAAWVEALDQEGL
jgi:NTP pyrophosphatase (non-canonical NTP hydrolase)